jgi:hypothetical protein
MAKENVKKEAVKEPSEDKVSVSAGLLESIQEELKELRNDRNMLLEIADERKKSAYLSRHRKKLPSRVFIRTLTLQDEKDRPVEKVVKGWRTIRDEVYKDPSNMVWREFQTVEIIFSDGTKRPMPLLEWYRNYKQVKAKVISRQKDEETDEVIFKVAREDNGEEYTIDSRYIN